MSVNIKVYEDVAYETLCQNLVHDTVRQTLVDYGVSESEIAAAEQRAQARADVEAAELKTFLSEQVITKGSVNLS